MTAERLQSSNFEAVFLKLARNILYAYNQWRIFWSPWSIKLQKLYRFLGQKGWIRSQIRIRKDYSDKAKRVTDLTGIGSTTPCCRRRRRARRRPSQRSAAWSRSRTGSGARFSSTGTVKKIRWAKVLQGLLILIYFSVGDPDPGWVKNQDPDLGWTTRIIFTKP